MRVGAAEVGLRGLVGARGRGAGRIVQAGVRRGGRIDRGHIGEHCGGRGFPLHLLDLRHWISPCFALEQSTSSAYRHRAVGP